jgi:hypothetical protein
MTLMKDSEITSVFSIHEVILRVTLIKTRLISKIPSTMSQDMLLLPGSSRALELPTKTSESKKGKKKLAILCECSSLISAVIVNCVRFFSPSLENSRPENQKTFRLDDGPHRKCHMSCRLRSSTTDLQAKNRNLLPFPENLYLPSIIKHVLGGKRPPIYIAPQGHCSRCVIVI